MSTLESRIWTGWDDGRQEHVTCAGWNQGQPQAVQNNSGSIRHDAYWYFRDITIPGGSVIYHSTITVVADNNIAGVDPNDSVMWLRVEDNGDPVPPDGINDICGRTFHSRLVQPENHRVGPGGVIVEDILVYIQYLVELPGWTASAVLVLWEAGANSITKMLQWVGFNNDPDRAGLLSVDYEAGEDPAQPMATKAIAAKHRTGVIRR